jgi:hypothetical protein
MTYIPQYNFPLFDSYAASLRAVGHDVISPAELDDPADRASALASPDGAPQTAHHFGKTWGDFLARDVKLLADGGIEGIVVLPGWERSRGARLETFVGNAMCGLPVFTWDATYQSLIPVRFLDLVRAWAAKADISFHSEVYA